MSFTTGLGGLLGGATEEAAKIKQERFQQDQANTKMANDMLQHIIDNPNIMDPNIKAQAMHAQRDLVMEHLFPDQFKRDKKNPVHKLIDSFIGQQQPQSASLMASLGGQGAQSAQPGVGSGNATSQVGGAPIPALSGMGGGPPSAPPNIAPVADTTMGGGPPSPQAAGVAPIASGDSEPAIQPPQMVNGFVNSNEQSEYEYRRKAQLDRQAKHQSIMDTLQMLQKDPNFQSMDPEHKNEVIASVYGAHYTPNTPRAPFTQERYDPATNKSYTDSYNYGPDGKPDFSSPAKSTERPPSAEEQQTVEDAKNIVIAGRLDPKIAKQFGTTEAEVRTHIHVQKVQDQELLRQLQQGNLALGEEQKKYYAANTESLIAQRQAQPLIQLYNDVSKEAEAEYQKELAAWEKNPIDVEQAAKGKMVNKPKPDPAMRDTFFDSIASSRGLNPATLRNAMFGISNRSTGDKKKPTGVNFMRAPDGSVTIATDAEVPVFTKLGAVVIPDPTKTPTSDMLKSH